MWYACGVYILNIDTHVAPNVNSGGLFLRGGVSGDSDFCSVLLQLQFFIMHIHFQNI